MHLRRRFLLAPKVHPVWSGEASRRGSGLRGEGLDGGREHWQIFRRRAEETPSDWLHARVPWLVKARGPLAGSGLRFSVIGRGVGLVPTSSWQLF